MKSGSFKPRRIEVEPHDSNTVIVVSGLMDGEVIVTQGSYQLQYSKQEDEHEKSSGIFHEIPLQTIIFIVIIGILFVLIFLKKKKQNYHNQ